VVSHADIIKLALAYYIGMHMDLFQRLEVSPCSVSALFFTRMGPRLLAYNDTGSLEHLKPRPEQATAAEQSQPESAKQAAESTNGVEAEPKAAEQPQPESAKQAAESTNGVEAEPARNS